MEKVEISKQSFSDLMELLDKVYTFEVNNGFDEVPKEILSLFVDFLCLNAEVDGEFVPKVVADKAHRVCQLVSFLTDMASPYRELKNQFKNELN